MVRVYVFYSLTHNKFIIKYSKSIATVYELGKVNQYNQVLLQVIDLTEPQEKSLKYTIKRYKYISRINKLYRNEIAEIKLERRNRKNAFLHNGSGSRHNWF